MVYRSPFWGQREGDAQPLNLGVAIGRVSFLKLLAGLRYSLFLIKEDTNEIFLHIHQVDVLESQFSQLLQQINATRDFESIRLAHDHFLSNLLAQSFILLKPVSRFSLLFYEFSNCPRK